MRLLFANGRQSYPLFQGGDGVSLHHLLSLYAQQNHRILAVGIFNPPHIRQTSQQSLRLLTRQGLKVASSPKLVSYSINGYRCQMLNNGHFLTSLPKIITTFNPDVIITQLNRSQDVIRSCIDPKRKVVLFVHDHDPLNYLSINLSQHISYVIFNSQNVSRHFKYLLHCPSSVIYPPIKLKHYLCHKHQPEYITMINPTLLKGVRVAETLAGMMPDEKFLFVRGWQNPQLSQSPPQNVTVLNRQYDMCEVYSKTKILLVPSQWEETFGRIIPEAGINEIPIIASQVGGIPEALGKGGLLVRDFTDPQAWFTATRTVLSNPGLARRLGTLAHRQALKFDLNRISKQVMSVLNAVNHS